MVDKLQLLAGDKLIEVDGITYKQPQLRDIKNLNWQKYYAYISFLLIDVEEYLKAINQENLIPYVRQYSLTMLDLCRENEHERQFLIEVLSFFIEGEINFYKGFLIINNKIIDKETYQKILEVIAEINCLKVKKQEVKYSNDKARKIAEKIAQAKQKRNNNKSKEIISLPDIISAVASRKESLNLLNIWDLTIYQLYDHYSRLLLEDNYDICAMNYAYWGGEFKAKHWSKALEY